MDAFFRRLKSRLGVSKAIVVTAHRLARLVYRLLQSGEAYLAQEMEDYEKKYRDQRARFACWSISNRGRHPGLLVTRELNGRGISGSPGRSAHAKLHSVFPARRQSGDLRYAELAALSQKGSIHE